MFTAKPPVKLVRAALADYPAFDALDNLLYDWFCWEASAPGVPRGYSAVDKTCALAHSARQWQSTDELMDADVAAWQLKQVAAAVDELDGDAQLAIRIEGRNRQGASVWRNPRAGALHPAVYAEAKASLIPMLKKRGVEY